MNTKKLIILAGVAIVGWWVWRRATKGSTTAPATQSSAADVAAGAAAPVK